MTNRVVIVTGANTGIGFEVTRILCEKGNDVILACRSEDRANRAIEKLKRQVPNALATYMQLDLASLESIRKFVDAFHATEKKLNILINNAGLILGQKDTKRQYTNDNFELVFGTNHLGHFLLTNLLLDDLKKSAAEEGGFARIIVVASSLHDLECAKKRFGVLQPLDLENLFLFNDGTYSGMQAYKNSKLANVMFTYELSRKLEGTGVAVNAVCPGFVPTTELMRSASGSAKFYCRYILHGMLRFTKATRSVQQAANAVVSLALDEKFKDVTGKYFKDGQEAKSSEESLDEEKQKKLWELSGGYTHLEGFEPIEVPPPPVPEEKTEKTPEVEANGEAAKEGDEKKPDGKEETAPKEDADAKHEAKGPGDKDKTDEKAEENKESEPKKEVEEKKEEEQKDEKRDVEEKKEEEKKEEETKEESKVEESEEAAVGAEEKEPKAQVDEQEAATPDEAKEGGNSEVSAADEDAKKKEDEEEDKKEGAGEVPADTKPAA